MKDKFIELKLKEFDERFGVPPEINIGKGPLAQLVPKVHYKYVELQDFIKQSIQQAYEQGLNDGYKGREKDMEASGGII